MQKITLGGTGLHETLAQDYGMKNAMGTLEFELCAGYVIYRFCDAEFKKCCFPLKQ